MHTAVRKVGRKYRATKARQSRSRERRILLMLIFSHMSLSMIIPRCLRGTCVIIIAVMM